MPPAYKDKNAVYLGYTRIPGADPATFKHIGYAYHVDRNRAYWSGEPIPGADPATMVVLGDSFLAKDQHQAYRSGETLAGIDVTAEGMQNIRVRALSDSETAPVVPEWQMEAFTHVLPIGRLIELGGKIQ